MSGRYAPPSSWCPLPRVSLSLFVVGLLLLFGVAPVQGQSFTTSTLQNLNITSPTSLQFGPDGRLYVSQQDGTILAVTVTKNSANDYSATNVETINLIKSIPNWNDDGTLAPAEWQGTRQVTGIYVTSNPSDPSLPMLYVGSSDPRIGAGTENGDLGLDTNSGIITRLTYNGSTWSAVDLVRGLPRSEENHSTNGLQLDAASNTLYVAQGGHTNAGAPSQNFALTTEYALSAAILSLDLTTIDALPTQTDTDGRQYKYLLPTLNDPTRTDLSSGLWSTVDSFDEARHENAAIQVGGKFYVLGGRETTTVRIYDPATGTWSTGATMPTTTGWPSTNLHHFQAVEVNGLIYAVGGFTGAYPDEPSTTHVYIYDPAADAWSLGPEIPVDRRRGSAGAAVYNGKIYLVGGNANGHSGPGSVQFDEFDPATGTFTALPDIPRARDHFFAIVTGDELYAIAGRESDLSDGTVFNQTAAEVDVYDFTTGTWTTLPTESNIPTVRAAPATGLIDGEIIVAGGETSQGSAHSETEAFDIQSQTWRPLSPMKTARHATQAIVYEGKMYVVAGSPNKGGANGEILDLEVLEVQSTDGYTDPNDPFGGNDGLNQAKVDPNGPVQIYSPGWRNAYDLVLTTSGHMWVIDNGPNPGWGGHPLGEADYPSDPDGDSPGVCTNAYDPNEPGSTGPGPGGDPKVNNNDNLHVVTAGYYGGHPTPVRGNLDAGLYLNGTWLQPGDPSLPADWTELVPAANPIECDYRNPGETDGALATWNKKSVNGIVEYTAQSAIQGDLLLTDLNGGTIQHVEVDDTGTGVLNTSTLASGLSAPLDVTMTDDSTPYPGAVWIATYGGGGSISILEPQEELVCEGTDSITLDEDGDGYTNADEIDNSTNLCSASDIPPNNDVADEQDEIAAGTRTFLLSDLNDSDDDNDAVADLTDPFQTDNTNGTAESLPLFKDLFLGSISQSLAGGVGFTGLMTNGTADYLTLFDVSNLLTGGATGQFSIIEVSSGTANGSLNTQENGFQFGFDPIATPYVAQAQMVGSYFNNSPQDGFEQGFYLGTGDQDNYAKIVLSASADFGALGADGGIEVVIETGGTPSRTLHPVNGLIGTAENVNLYLEVDPANGTLQPAYGVGGGSRMDLGTPISLSGDLLSALQGAYTIGTSVASGPAVGVITTTGGASTTFQADYEYISVRDASETLVTLTPVERLNSSGGSYTDTQGNLWSSDQYVTGGRKYSNSIAINGTEDDKLYQSERWGDFFYDIPVPAVGNYTVRLHFAEIYWGVDGGTGAPGERVFNVYVEGTKVLDQFDINAEVGPQTALVKEFSGVAVGTNQTLNIQFESIVDNAKISAIEVLQESGDTETTYTVATNVQGSGTVTKSPDQSSYTSGSTVDLTATPASGWEFVEWTGDVTGTTNPVSVTVNSNLSVTANFQETAPQYTITASTVGNGSIVKNPDQELYDEGTSVELTAVPDAGWYFAGWSGELTGTQNPITVTLNADYVISATFEELPTADAFIASLTVEDATGESLTRRFGADNLAIDGFDSGVDVKAPPAPPAGAFDARFDNSLAGPLFTDVRASVTYPSSITWILAIQGADTPIAVTWDPSLFPPGTLTMTSSVDGTTVDMKTQDEYVLATGPTDLTITFAPYDPVTLASVSKSVSAGWALWGLSYDVGARPFTSVLPLAEEGSLIGYEGAYKSRDRMHLGEGYWVHFASSGTETIDGYPVSKVTLALDAGWNLVTGPACEIALPSSITAAYVYENGSYVATTSSTPFKTFWAHVDAPTVTTLDCAATKTIAAKTASSSGQAEVPARMALTLTDANGAGQTLYVTSPTTPDQTSRYLLPPRPPQSLFDARFASDRRVSWERTPSISLQSGAYPITVSVTGKAASGSIVEQSSAGTGRTHLLRDGARFTVEDRRVSTLALNLPESVLKDLPKAFALKGNYPNPFVNTTTIVVDLPEEATIDLEVFNILGQRVMRLEDQNMPSGLDQTFQLQTSLTSGVYFYRMHAEMNSETVTKTGKMVVIQ